MSTQTNDGGPAFPHTHESWHVYPKGMAQPPPGMSLRDWFAGQAESFDRNLNDALVRAVAGRQEPDWQKQPLAYMHWLAEATAKWKMMQADAMLAARNNQPKEP